ncbi:LysR family transcriptional regulator [Celerinatantimonas sp. MCCC 1A17872]|uniref:LysR family transcriptional regulator n=1 Tax=Celerinatantimonas sp. MCCC 1A17872 TaxID=3177514 RepID=UPI0038BEF4A8
MKVERKNDINLRLLEIFGSVMRCQTTVDAAYELGISQPAVSTGIKQLEGQLGFPLFERINRRLLPTEDARLLFDEVEPIFMMIRATENRVRSLRQGNAGVLRILSTPPLGTHAVPKALKRFMQDRSNVKINFDVVGLNQVVQAVELGVADIGLVLGLDEHPAVKVDKIATVQMVCMVPCDHPLYRESTINAKQLRNHNYIAQTIESPLGLSLAHAFQDSKLPYQPDIEVRYTSSAAILAEAGTALAFVDAITAYLNDWKDVKIIPFEQPINISVCIVTRLNSVKNRLIQDFIADIKSIIEQDVINVIAQSNASASEHYTKN